MPVDGWSTFVPSGWLVAAALTVLKATAILAVATGAAWLLAARSAALRHLIWAGALGAVLLLPALDAGVPEHFDLPSVDLPAAWSQASSPADVRVARSRVPSEAEGGGRQTARNPEAGASSGSGASPAAGRAAARTPAGDGDVLGAVARLVLLLWGGGSVFLLLRMAWGEHRLRRIRRRADRLDDPAWRRRAREHWRSTGGRSGPPPIRVSPELSVPVTCGLLRPALLLPQEALDEWPRERTEAALVHELAHLRRRDTVTHMLGRLACAAYWFHPLVWRAARHAERERERACDDAVLRTGMKASAYARHLLEVARRGRPGTLAGAVAVSAARKGDLEGRVLAVLERGADRRPVSRGPAAGAVLAVVGLALALAAVSVEPGAARPGADGAVADTGGTPPATVEDTGEPDVAPSLLALLDDPDPAVRSAAAGALGRMKVGRAAGPLAEALEDPSPEVRRRAADALAAIEDPAAVEALARTVVSDASARVRKAAAWALGETESAAAAEALEAALDRVENRWVQKRIARALGETRQPSAVPVLQRLLERPDRKLRRAALEGLVENDTDRARAALAAALESDDPGLRAMTARVLGRGE